MKLLMSLALLITCHIATAETLKITQDGQTYSCTPDNGGGSDTGYPSCAEVSLDKNGYVASDCSKVQNDAQDICAGHAILKNGYVASDCLKLVAGGRCAITSMDKNGYVASDCMRVTNNRQDRCAAASITKNGYVASDCLRL